jgi:hypothetical protein
MKLRAARILANVVLLEILLLALMPPPAPTAAGSCVNHYWAATQENSGTYYGSRGVSLTVNAQVTGSENNFFVNSTFVWKDSYNYAEVGWTWHGGWSTPRMFVTSNKAGSVFHAHYSEVTVSSAHTYRTNALPGTTTWVFYGDSTQLTNRGLGWNKGTAGAQQERYYACDTPDSSHWYNLARADSGANFGSWTSLGSRNDNDPDYCMDKVSNTDFYTRRTGHASCDISS